MNTIVGAGLVFGCILMGYLMEHGNVSVLIQPAELVIIAGAAFGALIISLPGKLLTMVLKDFKKLFVHKSPTKNDYINLLVLLYDLCSKVRREGILSLENDIEEPQKSEIFRRHKEVIEDPEVMDFLRDNFRVIVMGVQTQEVAEILEIDLECSRRETMIPSQSLARMADSLPGLGIVAAVLGVVLTMGKISEPPAVLGASIGAALVGTFLGVLCCYGFVGPMAVNLEHKVKQKEVYFNVIKTALQHFENSPIVVIEMARREIPSGERPSFKEFEDIKSKWKTKKE
jgi:chemotaxis protein MotA